MATVCEIQLVNTGAKRESDPSYLSCIKTRQNGLGCVTEAIKTVYSVQIMAYTLDMVFSAQFTIDLVAKIMIIDYEHPNKKKH